MSFYEKYPSDYIKFTYFSHLSPGHAFEEIIQKCLNLIQICLNAFKILQKKMENIANAFPGDIYEHVKGTHTEEPNEYYG